MLDKQVEKKAVERIMVSMLVQTIFVIAGAITEVWSLICIGMFFISIAFNDLYRKAIFFLDFYALELKHRLEIERISNERDAMITKLIYDVREKQRQQYPVVEGILVKEFKQ